MLLEIPLGNPAGVEAIESQLVLTSGGVRSDLFDQVMMSCTPSIGTCGCFGCNGGWTEGAYDHLSNITGLTDSSHQPASCLQPALQYSGRPAYFAALVQHMPVAILRSRRVSEPLRHARLLSISCHAGRVDSVEQARTFFCPLRMLCNHIAVDKLS